MAEAAAQHAAPAEGKSGLLAKPAFLAVILLVVMAAEAGLLLLFLPGPASTGTEEGGHGDHGGHGATASAGGAEPEAVEVLIDSFSMTNGRAAPGATIHVTLKVTAVVPSAQQMAFEHAANQEHNARVRMAVDKVVRSASLDDLNDPNLTSVRRQIREEINKVLHKSYVTDVVISNYKTMEQ